VPRAEDGTLAIMVGGDPRDVDEARPVLACMGANIFHVGPVGSGEVAKLCNNLIAGVAAVAVSEAFRIAEGFGVDATRLTDVIAKSSGNTWVMEAMHPVPGLVPRSASSRDYAPGFMTDLMAKDLGLAVNAARELRGPWWRPAASRRCAWPRRTGTAARTSRRSTSSCPRATRRLFDMGPEMAPPAARAPGSRRVGGAWGARASRGGGSTSDPWGRRRQGRCVRGAPEACDAHAILAAAVRGARTLKEVLS
jgi:hypothetical protein